MPPKDGPRSPLFGLTTRSLGRQLELFDSLPSTNILARELASKGAREGTVVMASQQTEGMGRMGRSFASPRGGLYLSVILRPKVQPELISPLPLVFGLSAAKAIASTALLDARLKWPNDVLIGDRKVCGIMTMSTISKGRVEFVIIGVGINANSNLSDLPGELSSKATTIREVSGREVDLNELSRNLLYFMDLHYSMFLDDRTGQLLDEWSERSATLKRKVRVDMGNTTITGTALGVDTTGALLVRTDDGIVLVPSGDCTPL